MSRTFKHQAASQRTKLKRIKGEIVEMAEQWTERDNFFVQIFESLAQEIDEVLDHLAVENVMDGEL